MASGKSKSMFGNGFGAEGGAPITPRKRKPFQPGARDDKSTWIQKPKSARELDAEKAQQGLPGRKKRSKVTINGKPY